MITDKNINTIQSPMMPMAEAAHALRKHRVPLLIWVLLCLSGGIIYSKAARPEFTSYADIILNPSKQINSSSNNSSDYAPTLTLDSSQAESQIQVLKSERVLNAVFVARGYAEAQESQEGNSNLLNTLYTKIFGGSSTNQKSVAVRRKVAFDAFMNRVSVRRLGQSYVLEVAFQGPNAEESAKVVNSILMQYIKSQIELKSASIQRGSEYLKGRIESIKAQLTAADAGVKDGKIPEAQFPDADAQIISSAVAPLTKSSPKTTIIIAICLTFSSFLGLTFLVLKNLVDHTIKIPAQIKHVLNSNLFGTISWKGKRGSGFLNNASKLYPPDAHRSVLKMAPAEFLSTLAKVRIAAPSRGKISIGVFSWSLKDGKTTVSTNLAMAASSIGSSVVLIDMDGKGRKLYENKDGGDQGDRLHFKGIEGLHESGGRGIVSDGSRIISVSLENSERQFYESTVQEVLKSFKAHSADFAIFDFAAMSSSPDVLALCKLMDCCILVVCSGKTTIEEAELALSAIYSAGGKAVGVVLNKYI